jgi:hypothetical protein
MTRLEALRALYAAVKDGTLCQDDTISDTDSQVIEACFPLLIGDVWAGEYVALSAVGSVDAALDLIAATLPGWAWCVFSSGEATLALADDDPILDGITETADHHATALLLACIAAHIAIEDRGE